MGVDVIAAILRVVLDHEDERVVRIRAMRDLLDQQAYRVIVVGHFEIGRVHAVDRLTEISGVIVHQAHQAQGGQIGSGVGAGGEAPNIPTSALPRSRPPHSPQDSEQHPWARLARWPFPLLSRGAERPPIPSLLDDPPCPTVASPLHSASAARHYDSARSPPRVPSLLRSSLTDVPASESSGTTSCGDRSE